MIYYYNLWIIFEKEVMKMTFTPPKHQRSAPVPIPRTGIGTVPSLLLHILLCLTAAMIPLGLATAFGAVRIPSVAVEIIAVSLLILTAVYFFRMGKLSGKSFGGLLPILGFIALFLIYMTGSAAVAATAISLIFFVGEGSMLLATQTKRALVWFPLAPLAALGLSLAVCTRIDTALLCLLPLPATLALALGTRSSAASEDGLTRVGVICLTSFCLGVTVAGFGAWFLYQSMGTLEPSAIQSLIDHLQAEITGSILELHLDTGNEIVYPFEGKEALISNAVTVTFNILPAIGVVLVNMISSISQMVTLSGLSAFGFGSSVSDHVKEYRISAISSFFFLVACIVTLIANAESSTIVGTVAENLTIILLPGLGLAGFLRLISTMARKGCAPGCLIFLLFPIILFLSFNILLILAGYEAISAVFGPLVAKLKPPRDDDSPFPPSNDDEGGDENEDDNTSSHDNDSHQDGPSLF